MSEKARKEFKLPKYTVLTLDEAVRLMICVAFDVVEYAIPILLTPIIGDILDIVGLGVGIVLFGWFGLISILEFLPIVDYFPVFILMWTIWYYLKKQDEKEKLARLKEKWK
jgi:hypothetical protein